MSAYQPQHQEVILGEDGELRQSAAVQEAHPVYCTQCGSANRGESRYCRTCGESLDQQAAGLYADLDTLPVRKSKRLLENAPATNQRPTTLSVLLAAIVEIFTLFAVMVMVGVLANERQSGFIFLVLAGWGFVEVIRHQRR